MRKDKGFLGCFTLHLPFAQQKPAYLDVDKPLLK